MSLQLLIVIAALGVTTKARAQSINIANEIQFDNAINTINANPTTAFTLNITSGFTLSSAPNAFSSNSIITINANGSATTLDGGGMFQPFTVNSGTVDLNNLLWDNTGATPITINGGTLSVGATGGVHFGSNIIDDGALVIPDGGTIATNVSGTGSLEIGTGSGNSVTLSGVNTYSGGTTVDANNTLIGTTDNLQGAIVDNGLLQFNQTVSGSYNSIISGTGSVEISGSGPVTFTGLNSYTGGTTIDAGSTLIASNGALDTSSGDIANSGALVFSQAIGTLCTFSGNITGTGTVEIAGGGTVTLAGTNSYSGLTTIDASTTLIATNNALSALSGNIINDGALIINQGISSGVFYSGNISGSGSVEIGGAAIPGSVTLTGMNNYTGGTTVDSFGTLTGTTSSLQGTIFDNGQVIFHQASAGTFGSLLTGAGSVEISGMGPITFTAANDYLGGTTVDAGATLIYSGLSTLQGDITDNGSVQLQFPSSGISVPYTGILSGNGAVEISGGGTLIISGANTFSGTTTIDAGNTLIATNNSLGNVNGNIVDNGDLVFSQSSGTSGYFGGNISGSGSVEIRGASGADTVTLTGTNTYTGGTTVDPGNTLIGSTSSLQGTIFDNGSVIFDQTTAGTFTGLLTGTGNVEISGPGPITYVSPNNYSGGTTIDAGASLIYSGLSTLQGNVIDNGNLQVLFPQPGAAATYSGILSGGGTAQISGGGTLTVTGANTFSGTTTIDAGSTLMAGTNSLTGVTGNINNNGTLQFNQTVNSSSLFGGNIDNVGTLIFNELAGTTSTYGGDITGNGSIEFMGGGIVNLTGHVSGNGTTIIGPGSPPAGGNGIVPMTLVGSLQILSGGQLAPAGTVALNTTPATYTITKDLTTDAGSLVTVQVVSPTIPSTPGLAFHTAAVPTNPELKVMGNVNINPDTRLNVLVNGNNYQANEQFLILQSINPLVGHFQSAVFQAPGSNLTFKEVYTDNALILQVLSTLPQNLGNSLGQVEGNNYSYLDYFNQVNGMVGNNYLNNNSNGAYVLNQVSGEIYANIGAIQAQVKTSELQIVSNRLGALISPASTGDAVGTTSANSRPSEVRFVSYRGADGQVRYLPYIASSQATPTWTGWVQGYGQNGNISGGFDYGMGGTLFGVERWLDDSTMIGLLGGYTGSSIAQSPVAAHASLSGGQVGLYELHRGEVFYISNIDTYTSDSYSTSRLVNIPGVFAGTASGSSSGNQYAHYTEIGATVGATNLRMQPFAGVQYLYLGQNGLNEAGAGKWDLNTNFQATNSTRTSFGLRVFTELTWWGMRLVPTASARYQHEWGDGTQLVTSSFAGGPPGFAFTTAGGNTGRDFALFTVGGNAIVTDHCSLYGMFDTQAAAHYGSVMGSGGIQFAW